MDVSQIGMRSEFSATEELKEPSRVGGSYCKSSGFREFAYRWVYFR